MNPYLETKGRVNLIANLRAELLDEPGTDRRKTRQLAMRLIDHELANPKS
jgi:hypothetical protein